MSLLLRLILSETAVILTLSLLIQTPLFSFLPILAIIFLIPILSLPFRNPFNSPLFALLLFLSSTPLFSSSEMFSAVLDTIYYFGYEELARNLRDFFSLFPDIDVLPYLLGITTLYVISAVIEGIEEVEVNLRREGIRCGKCYISKFLAFVAISAFLILSTITSTILTAPSPVTNIDPFLIGLTAALLSATAVLLLMKGVGD